MNERIRLLAVQANIEFTYDPTETPMKAFAECWEDDLKKFAQLIVQECAEVCYHHSEAAGGVDTAFGYGYKDCGNDIKKHFGVEEC